MRKVFAAVAALAMMFGLAACNTEADTVSHNLSLQAEQFQVERRVVFVNGITDTYLLVIEGLCSVETGDGSKVGGAVEVTCKTGPNSYIKNGMILSDNVTVVWDQVESNNVDPYHYQIEFRPETIAPYIQIQTSTDLEGNG